MRVILSLISFAFIFCVNLYPQSFSAGGSWGSHVGLGAFEFLPNIESGQLVTLYSDIPLSQVTPVSQPLNDYYVIWGQIDPSIVFTNYISSEPVAIKLFADGGNYTGKIGSVNWSDFYMTQAPAVPPNFNFTITSSDEVIIYDSIGLYLVPSGVGSHFGAGPEPEPPVINLENEYLLIQNKSFILDVTDSIISEGGTVTYQWYLPNGTTYPDNLGGNTSILDLSGEESNAGLWSLEVTDDGGTTSHNLNLIYKKDTDGDGIYDDIDAYPNNPTLSEEYIIEYVSGNFNWEEAQSDAVTKGGRLAVIDTIDKINFTTSFLLELDMDIHPLIGLKLNAETNAWEWVNGEAITIANWGPGEPNDNPWYEPYGNCFGGDNYQWNSVSSNTRPGGYLIEYLDSDGDGILNKDEVNLHSTDPNNSDSDGDGLNDGDETYIYHTNPNNSDADGDGLTDFEEVITYNTDPASADTDNDGLGDSNEVISFAIINGPFSWEEARMDAISKNGRLAIIDNDEKQNIVESIASQLEDHIMLWIGLSDSQTEGHWKWINGTELNYNNWGPDEPNANANEDYATFSTGGWGMNFGQWMDTLPYGLADDEWDYIIEYTELTDPNDSDSDDDGLSDGDEVNVYSTNPNNLDSDADGLSDGNEVNVYSTNPNSTDSDSDQISDYDEINTHLTDPNLTDSDSDQLSDYSEINLHSTDPNDSDSDDDGLSDGDEVNLYSTDPNNQDTDDDNYLDANDEFPLDVNEWLDTDGDTIGDNADTDDDNDSYLDAADAFPLDASEWLDTDGDTIGNNADTDDDNDTILDYKEIEIGSNPLVLDTLESLVTIIDELILNNSSKLSIDEVKDLRPGSTMMQISGNQATVQFQMEESSDLQTWEDKGDPATMTIPADTDTKFFRFKMAE